MAFEARGLAPHPSTTGRNGRLCYAHATDNLSTILNNDYWDRNLSTATATDDDRRNLQARKSAEDFVRSQRIASGRGVMMDIMASDENIITEARLTGDGRLTLQAATSAFAIT